MCVRRRERVPEGGKMGELDGRMVSRLEGLVRVREEIGSIHERGLIMLLTLQASARLCGEARMVRVEWSVDGFGIHTDRI